MAIELQNVCKAFGEKQVLQDFSHTFPEGELTCIMGPSGCGKTTLLSLLLGLEQPDAGEILGMEGRRKSAVFQEDRLCENASAVSNIRLVNPALSKRRVAILRALAAEYDVLFCDEPFKGLDQATKAQVLDYFLARTQGKTVLVVTHDPEEAKSLGGHTLLL